MQLSRRHLLATAGALGATGLLAACGAPSPAPTVAPPAAPTAPATAPAPASAPAASPTAKPQPASPAAPSPSASPAVAAAPSPSTAPQRATAAAPAAAGKQMYQYDAQHTGRSPYPGPRQGNVLRRFDTSTPDNMPPDVAIPRDDFQSSSAIGPDGTIYVANFPGVLFALRDSASARDQLEPVWRFHPPMASSFHATPALSSDGSLVYLAFSAGGFQGTGSATFYALRTASAGPSPEVAWMVDLGPTRVMTSPTVGPDGTIYFNTSSGQLFAISPAGQIDWTARIGPSTKSASALGADGTIYQPSADGNLYALSPRGEVKWTFAFGEHLGPTPLITAQAQGPGPGGGGGGGSGMGSGASPTVAPDGTIFIGANNSNMYALAPDGSMKWLFEAERELAGIWTTPALSADNATIYFGANKGGVYAVNTADGSKRWQFPVYGSVYASSVLDPRGVLYTGTTIEHLYALDSASGEPIWDLDIHNQVWSAPSIRPDGTVAIADRGGVVQVIG